jgi:hypothetical protein
LRSEFWLAQAKPFLLTALALLLLFGLMDISPAFYGPYEFIKDHPGIAPWFSGTATMLGVFAALYNADRQLKQALDRQALDDQRRDAEAENAKRKLTAVAAQMVGLVAFASFNTRQMRTGESRNFAFPVEMQVWGSILKRMESFPIFDLENDQATTCWHRIESEIGIIYESFSTAQRQTESHENVQSIQNCEIITIQVNSVVKMLDLIDENCREFWIRVGTQEYKISPRPIEERIGIRTNPLNIS